MNRAASQQALIVYSDGLSEDILIQRRKVIRCLGIIEIVFGTIMIGFGIFTAIHSSNFEAIAAGIWVTVAGGLGIGAGGHSSTPCLINSHMGFSIVATISSIGLAVMTGVAAANLYQDMLALSAVTSIMSFISSVSAIILIVSASFCCCSNPLGCCGGCCGQQVYVGGEQQQQPVPVQVQVSTNTYTQGQVPPQPESGNMPYGNPVPVTSTNLPKKAGAFPHHGESPPAYQNQ